MKLIKAVGGIVCIWTAIGILLYTIFFQPENMSSMISWILTLFSIGILFKKGIWKIIFFLLLFYFASIVLHYKEDTVIDATNHLSEYLHGLFRGLFIRGM